MTLIERYIFRNAGIATLTTLGALAGVVWIVQALRGIDIITTNGQTIFTYLQLTTLAVPNLILAVIPIALLLSCIHTINTLNTNTELVVLTASGASNWSVAKPMLVLALLCSLFVGLVGHIVSPYSLVKLRQYVTEMRADLVSIIVREGAFNEVEEGLTFHVARREAGGILGGILISDDRDPDTSIIYTANHGIVTRIPEGSFLKLKDGEIQQTGVEDGSVSVVKFDSYIFDLSSLSGKTTVGSRKAKERFTWELINPDVNDKVYQNHPGRFRSQLHERFAEMLWPFAYVLMILAFAGQTRSNRQSYSASVGAAATSVVVARGFGFSAITALRADPSAVFLVYALPLGCIVFGSWFVWSNRPASLPKPAIDWLERHQMKLQADFERLHSRYIRFRRRLAGVRT